MSGRGRPPGTYVTERGRRIVAYFDAQPRASITEAALALQLPRSTTGFWSRRRAIAFSRSSMTKTQPAKDAKPANAKASSDDAYRTKNGTFEKKKLVQVRRDNQYRIHERVPGPNKGIDLGGLVGTSPNEVDGIELLEQ